MVSPWSARSIQGQKGLVQGQKGWSMISKASQWLAKPVQGQQSQPKVIPISFPKSLKDVMVSYSHILNQSTKGTGICRAAQGS